MCFRWIWLVYYAPWDKIGATTMLCVIQKHRVTGKVEDKAREWKPSTASSIMFLRKPMKELPQSCGIKKFPELFIVLLTTVRRAQKDLCWISTTPSIASSLLMETSWNNWSGIKGCCKRTVQWRYMDRWKHYDDRPVSATDTCTYAAVMYLHSNMAVGREC